MYIGQAVNIPHRIRGHISSTFNENNNSYNQVIHQAIRKYGIENFSFSVLEYCNREELDAKEKYYIQFYQSIENGYNVALGGEGGPCSNPEIELKRENTVEAKYGVKHLIHNEEIKQQIFNTFEEKYGGFLMASDEIRKSVYETKLQKGIYRCLINLDTGLVFSTKEGQEWTGVKDFSNSVSKVIRGIRGKSCGKIPDDPRIKDKSLIGKPAHWDYISYEEYIKLKEQQNELM